LYSCILYIKKILSILSKNPCLSLENQILSNELNSSVFVKIRGYYMSKISPSSMPLSGFWWRAGGSPGRADGSQWLTAARRGPRKTGQTWGQRG
jgi:hypothetical protein